MPGMFSFVDYGVFSLVLVVSALIGFYYAWTERHNKSVDRVLLGERKLKVFISIDLVKKTWPSCLFNNKDVSSRHVNHGLVHICRLGARILA